MSVTSAVILIGGPASRGNFLPLDLPGPLLPIAGLEMIIHQIYALTKIPGIKDIHLYGYYENFQLKNFISSSQQRIGVTIHYQQEPTEMGTAGTLAAEINTLFKDQDNLIVLHSDICSDFPLKEMYDFHIRCIILNNPCTVMACQVNKEEFRQFGNFVMDIQTNQLIHYAEKPEQFISNLINCGVYIFNKSFEQAFLQAIQDKFQVKTLNDINLNQKVSGNKEKHLFLQYIQLSHEQNKNYLSLEKDIIIPNAGKGKVFVYHLDLSQHFWGQVKSPSDILRTNVQYLTHYQNFPQIYNVFPECIQLQNFVLIHKTAVVSPKAKLGPYVFIGAGCRIEDGVRISNSIIYAGVEVKVLSKFKENIRASVIQHHQSQDSIHKLVIGVELKEQKNLKIQFLDERVTVLGIGVQVDNEVSVRNSIALPKKRIQKTCEGETIF